jgi:PAS domain S-box-containing protein
MRIFHKLILGFLSVTLLIWAVGFIAVSAFRQAREKTISGYTLSVADMILEDLDREIRENLERLDARSKGDRLQTTVLESNEAFKKMPDPEAEIDRREREWMIVPEEEITPFMRQILDLPLSHSFREEQTLYRRRQGYPLFGELFVTNRFGAVAGTSNKTTDYRQNDETWWKEAWKKGFFVDAPEMDPSSKTFVIPMAVRVENDRREPIGVFKGALDFLQIMRQLKRSQNGLPFRSGRLFLLDADGRYLFPQEKFGQDAAPFLKSYLADPYACRESHLRTFKSETGEVRSLICKRSNKNKEASSQGWTLITSYDSREIFGPNRRMEAIVFGVAFMATVFSALAGFFIALSFSRPLEKLRCAADRFGEGDLRAPVGIVSRDEFGMLARDLEAMAENIRNKTTSIGNLDREVEERKLLEKTSLENALFLQKLMDSIPAPVFYKDISGVYIGCNGAFESFFGIAQKELVGKKAGDIFSPDVARLYQEKDKELLAIPGIQIYEALVKDGSGDPRSIVFYKATFEGPSGEVQGIIGVIMDITLRKRAEESREASQKFLNATLNTISDIFYVFDPAGNFLLWNQAFERVTGYLPEEISRMKAADFFDGPGAVQMAEAIQVVFEKGFNTVEENILTKDGRKIPVFFSGSLSQDAAGRPILCGVGKDITERKKAEEELRWLLKSMSNAFALFDSVFDSAGNFISYRFVFINDAYERITGVKLDAVKGKAVHEVWPQTEPEWIKRYGEVAVTGVSQDFELFHAPTKKLYHCNVYRPWETKNRFCVVFEDITERKQAEELLAQSHAQYEQVISNISDVIWRYEVDAQGRFVSSYISPVVDRLLGLSDGTINNSFEKYFSYVHPDDISGMQEAFFTGLRARQKMVAVDGRLVKPGGDIVWVHSTGSAFAGDNGGTVGFGTTVDVTERRRAEEALRESEKRFMDVLYAAQDAILLIDGETFVDCNEVTARMLGYSNRAEFLMKHPSELSPPTQPDGRNSFEKANEMMKLAFERGFNRFEWVHRKANGEDFPVEVSLTPISIHGKNVLHCLWRDMTELKKIADQIRKLSQAMEQSPSCVVITDKDGKIEYVNQKFTELTGYASSEVRGQNPRILKSGEQPPEFYKDLWDTILHGKDWQGQICNKKKNGELYWELAHIAPLRDEKGEITHFVAVKEDITYRRQIEAELRHSLRMEAVGRLAGGIAHDFNNMLTVINGYSGYVLGKMKPEDPYYTKLRDIRDAGDCAATIVRQLLNLSRKEAAKPQLVKVSDATGRMQHILNRLLGDSIELVLTHAPEAGSVKMDPGQLEQIFLNLIVNARESMPEGGTLTVTTEHVRMEEIHEELIPSKERTGDFVRITVKDTGTGIDPALRTRIFEPFFTTKKRGMNTGLGLSIIRGIVEQSGGALSLESQVGKGTTFRVYLPQAPESVGSPEKVLLEDLPAGQGKILLVEDETRVREFALHVLRERGYDVRVARGGDEALRMLAEDPGRKYDLVLTDLTMPKMNGKELVTRIREKTSGLKVIFMSGYSEQKVAEVEDAVFLQKPFSHRALAMKVWEVLGR